MKLPPYNPSPFQRLIQRIAMTRWITQVLAAILPGLDRAMLSVSGGRRTCTSLLTGLPTFQVTTFGARSGLPRQGTLVGIVDGKRILLVASNFGRANHPAWYHNLRANPRAVVALAGEAAHFSARLVCGDEVQRCLDLADAYYPGFALYRQRAAPRQIPVFILSEDHP